MRPMMFFLLVVSNNIAAEAAVVSLDQIRYWIGEGPDRAALVIDWDDEGMRRPLVWGYRFTGSVTAQQMLEHIAMTDQRFFARLGTRGPFGRPIYGLGYDRDGDGFGLSDGTAFVDGIAVTGPSETASALDADDSYREGWIEGYWAYFVGADPYQGDPWSFASTGPSQRILVDGGWDGFRFTSAAAVPPGPAFPAQPPVSSPFGPRLARPSFAIPEADSALLILLAIGCAGAARYRPGPLCLVVAGGCWLFCPTAATASHFATAVIEYVPGTDIDPLFTDPGAALGAPTRFTSPQSPFGGAVTPFQSPFGADQVVSIGHGGRLVLRFDRAVADRPLSTSFGVDLLVFGNAFYFDAQFPNGVVGDLGAEPGTIEVSQDGSNWFPVAVMADTAFPTMGFKDVLDPFSPLSGTVPTDFRRPVDPTLDPQGFNYKQLVDAYDGSGGGTGVDISSTGLGWIQFVRISNPHMAGTGISPEIDAVSIVPEPQGMMMFAGYVILLFRFCSRGRLVQQWNVNE